MTIDEICARRVELLSGERDLTADEQAEFDRLTQQLRELDPRVTEAEWRALEQTTMALLESELTRLRAERALLVHRELDGSITDAESQRLSAISWCLDQYELAQLGPDLRAMERRAEKLEALAAEVNRVREMAKPAAG